LEIELDEFVVMPNHFHGIVMIHDGIPQWTKTKINWESDNHNPNKNPTSGEEEE